MIKLVLSNIGKHRVVYALLALLFFVLSFYLVSGLNILSGVQRSLHAAVVDNLSGSALVVPRSVKSIDLLTKDGEKKLVPLEAVPDLLAYLDAEPVVVAASPRLRVWGAVKTDLNSMPMILVGVDPVREQKLLPGRLIDEGDWLNDGDQINLYYRHSDYLSALLGDPIGVMTSTESGYSNLEVAQLSGILDYQDLQAYTDYALLAFVSQEFLHKLRQDDPNLVGEIAVRLQEGESVARFQERLEQAFPGRYRVVLPQDSAALIHGITTLTDFCVFAVAAVLLLMVVLCGGFLVNISIENRRHEIGIYQAIGVRNLRIGLQLGQELAVVVLWAGGLGILCGKLFLAQAFADGIEATITPLKLIFGRESIHLPNSWSVDLAVMALVLLTFLGNLTYSIRRLERLQPVEVLREV